MGTSHPVRLSWGVEWQSYASMVMEIIQLSSTRWTNWLYVVRGSRLPLSATKSVVVQKHTALDGHDLTTFTTSSTVTGLKNDNLRLSVDRLMLSPIWRLQSSCRWNHGSPPVRTLARAWLGFIQQIFYCMPHVMRIAFFQKDDAFDCTEQGTKSLSPVGPPCSFLVGFEDSLKPLSLLWAL